jgi:dTDP-4-dehydrorhamnose 3,5-epimerase
MQFIPAKIAGAYLVELERIADDRGFFARTWCEREFAEHGLDARLVQCSLSFSPERGTLRGMHYQAAPHAEVKLVRCTRGVIFDVIVDLRPDSPTRMAWEGFELSADNRRAVYIPEGLAHGFLTLASDCETLYQMSTHFRAEAARGVRWNDPAFGIAWPGQVAKISSRDANYPLWQSPPTAD